MSVTLSVELKIKFGIIDHEQVTHKRIYDEYKICQSPVARHKTIENLNLK